MSAFYRYAESIVSQKVPLLFFE